MGLYQPDSSTISDRRFPLRLDHHWASLSVVAHCALPLPSVRPFPAAYLERLLIGANETETELFGKVSSWESCAPARNTSWGLFPCARMQFPTGMGTTAVGATGAVEPFGHLAVVPWSQSTAVGWNVEPTRPALFRS